MLRQRHSDNRARFETLAERLNLGLNYPLDASRSARFRPDTPLVRYLDPLVYRLHSFFNITRGREYDSEEAEKKDLATYWRHWTEDLPGDQVIKVLRDVRRLPPLTKSTAHEWAKKAVVPLILATDALNYSNCTQPALKAIAGQRGVKSPATFKSRLLAAVIPTLRSMARPA
jgi:hypothetical protein